MLPAIENNNGTSSETILDNTVIADNVTGINVTADNVTGINDKS